MNYSIKTEKTLLLFSISKDNSHPNLYKGWFMYSSDCGQYLSTNINGRNETSVMERMFYQAIREIKKCYGEEIEELANTCLKKIYDSKQQKLNLEYKK